MILMLIYVSMEVKKQHTLSFYLKATYSKGVFC